MLLPRAQHRVDPRLGRTRASGSCGISDCSSRLVRDPCCSLVFSHMADGSLLRRLLKRLNCLYIIVKNQLNNIKKIASA